MSRGAARFAGVISTLLAGDPTLYRVLLVAVVLVIVIAGYLLVKRRPGSLVVLKVGAALSLGAVLAFTLSPAGGATRESCNLDLSFAYFLGIERFANVALFVPLAYLVSLATRRPILIFAATSLISVGIETVQVLLPGLGRACDINDWLTNTLGAAIGALLAGGALRVSRRR